MASYRGYEKRLEGPIHFEQTCKIMWKEFCIGYITWIENEFYDIEVQIKPDWKLIDYLTTYTRMPEEIEGIDYSEEGREEVSIRDHIPAFVRRRVPPEGREDVPAYLQKYGLDYYHPWHLLVAMRGRAYGELYLEPIEEVIKI